MSLPAYARPVAAKLGRVWTVSVFCGLLTSCAAVDTPDACRLTHVADIPIRLVRNMPVVEVQIGGKPLRMLLDTGAESLVVTPEAADRLGLDRDYSRFGYTTGLGAKASYWPTKPDAIQIGSVTVEPKPLVVGTILTNRSAASPEGLLGGLVLSDYDLDIDIAQRRLSLYERRRCPSGPAPFSGPGFSVQASRVGAFRMAVPVSLNGTTVPMMVDTGANPSLVDPVAVGLSEADMQTDRAGRVNTADPVGLSVHLHTFDKLTLGSDTVNKPRLVVGHVEGAGFNGLLGMDYWRNHRLWMSYGSGTLFVGLPSPQQNRP